MLYYLGKGTEFKKENCKEYKTKTTIRQELLIRIFAYGTKLEN